MTYFDVIPTLDIWYTINNKNNSSDDKYFSLIQILAVYD